MQLLINRVEVAMHQSRKRSRHAKKFSKGNHRRTKIDRHIIFVGAIEKIIVTRSARDGAMNDE